MELNPTPIPVVHHPRERFDSMKAKLVEISNKGEPQYEKRGLCFICSIFVVRAKIKVTLLMSSFSSILFKLFVFTIEAFSILMMIFLSNLMAM